ncbi:hypothetical protein BCR44DRAFT_44624, partial [Catenaria anguillulae PL171]
MHPPMTVTPAQLAANTGQSSRLTLPSLSPLTLLDDGLLRQRQHPSGDNSTHMEPQPGYGTEPESEPSDRPLARAPRRPVNGNGNGSPLHGLRPDFDTSAEMAAIARLSLALDSAAASSLSLALSTLPPPSSSSSTPSAQAAAEPSHSTQPAIRPQRPLSIVNTLPPPTLPTLGPPRPPAPTASTPRPSLPAYDPLSPLRMFTWHEDAGALSDTDTLSRDERRAARDPAPPYFDPTAHFYPELDAFGNVRVTVPILPDLETRQAVVKMLQMHYVPPPANSLSNTTDAQHHHQHQPQQGKVVPPGAMQQGAGDWVLFGHASASSLCYLYRQGAHVVTIALVPTAPDSAASMSSPLSDQLIIPLSPRSPTHHSRLLTQTLTRRPSSSVGHAIQVYHAIDKRLLPLSPVELSAAADVLTFVQRRAHYRSSMPKRRPSSASIRSTRSSIHVPLHAPPKYYDLSLHRGAAGSPPPFESLSRRASSVRRLSVSRREAAAGDPRAVMRRTLSRRGSGRIAAAPLAPAEPSPQECVDSESLAVESPALPIAAVGPTAGKRKLGSGFMKRWSRVVGGNSKHHSAAPSSPLLTSTDAPAVPPTLSSSTSPFVSQAALGAPSSRRSSASSAASGQSSPAFTAVCSLAAVAESPSSPLPPRSAATSSPSQAQGQLAAATPPPVPPKDSHHHASSSSSGGHRLSMSPSMLFKKVKAALPSASKA